MGTEALNLSKKELLNLGEQYLKIRNYDNAMKYLSRAVLQGSSRAGTKLFELAKAFYKKQDFGPAFRAFQLLADKGHGESSLYLGKMYERGLGVKASLQKSFDCYAVAYQQGIPMGAYLAGKLMTTDALRSEEVRDIAISWFREAIAGGVYESYAAIGKLYMEDGWRAQPGDPPKSNKTALSWFLRGAVRGDNLSREMAGDFFITGTGTAQDIRRGMELYTQAFHDGSVFVCFKLGDLYSNGRYVHKNLDLSIAWYLKAYERGDVRGKYYAGHISFLAGKVYPALPEGTEEKKKALQYLEQAASLGYGDAFEILADISRSQRKYKEFEDRLKQGMNAGSDMCREKLIRYCCSHAMKVMKGMHHFPWSAEGTRVDLDFQDMEKLKETAAWYKKAAAAGDTDSWAMLARFYFFYGDILGIKEKDFTKAARQGKPSRIINTEKLLWRYYAEPQTVQGGVFHKENPKKAFQLAHQLARNGYIEFFKVLSSYYSRGYGTKENSRMADYWAGKARSEWGK